MSFGVAQTRENGRTTGADSTFRRYRTARHSSSVWVSRVGRVTCRGQVIGGIDERREG
jgi:hypothetical protein